MQLLEKNRLSLIWTDIIMKLSSDISHFVRPDVCLNKDLMDISSYVHIKKVGVFIVLGHVYRNLLLLSNVWRNFILNSSLMPSSFEI